MYTVAPIARLTRAHALWACRYQGHKGLLKYILEPPVALAGAAHDAVAKKNAETVDILMKFMSKTAFESVITPNDKDNPHAIWNQIISCYASTSSNNKGRVWLKFMRYEYRGNLSEFINNMHKMLIEIALVKLGVPDNILCFSILSKLSEDLWNVVDNIIMNEVIIKSPNATLTKLQELVHLEESRKKKTQPATSTAKAKEQSDAAAALMHESKRGKRCNKKDRPICKNGKHNPLITTHSVNSFKSKPIVLDTGATHHLINNPNVFQPTSNTSMKIATGGHSNFLSATATLTNHVGQKIVLNNVLLVLTLNRSLISIPCLFEKQFLIKKFKNDEVEIEVDGGYQLLGSVKNNLLELHSSHFDEMNLDSACYQSSPESPNWHVRLGHPNPKYLKHLKLEDQAIECPICKECKSKALPFSSKFKAVTEVLKAVHMDLVGPFPVQSTAGSLYFLTLIDQHSGFKNVKFLRQKSETFNQFVEFKNQAEKQTKKLLCILVSDGGG
ncbi:hypothetical protein PCASD_13302 [Puccinia coronata f. sp. avenae]|uniref:Retrovirus-related Pol polyprotein from transposon TNT 1-94-like beta-barrel domain-containing protein n=1 Tax=Puccinia coronata f. sp. avenae TaxID=200324 RepID=A0A2N5U8X0_9BASI|nr:hypothetical protein PCASD_13302 [Puccinia coronata f. sp. avenae]